MDPTKNYIKLAGQPVQEIEVRAHLRPTDKQKALYYDIAPPPEKSLEQQVKEELVIWETRDAELIRALCKVFERKLKALKE